MNMSQRIASQRQVIEQHRIQLFLERNKYKERAEYLERQLYEQRQHSFIVIAVLLTVIVLMFGMYILCLEYLIDPSLLNLNYHDGNNWFMTVLQWLEAFRK